MWKLAKEVATQLKLQELTSDLEIATYLDLKSGDLLNQRRKVKKHVRNVMGGWIRNEGGEDFTVAGVET
jgi:tRNA-specific adenosine deaminase 1